jgi:hypothetical protein
MGDVRAASAIPAAAARVSSIRARKPAHRELDAVVRQYPPGFYLSHVCRLWKTAKHLACLLPRSLARQCKRFTPERIAATFPFSKRFGRAARDIGGTATKWIHLGTAHIQCNAKTGRKASRLSSRLSWPTFLIRCWNFTWAQRQLRRQWHLASPYRAGSLLPSRPPPRPPARRQAAGLFRSHA